MLRMCMCGGLAPRGAKCPHCGRGGPARSGSPGKRRLGGATRQRMSKRIQREQGYRCAECGVLTTRVELDHIVPLGLDGTEDRANLQTLCPPCHRLKTTADQHAIRERQRDEGRPTARRTSSLRAYSTHSRKHTRD